MRTRPGDSSRGCHPCTGHALPAGGPRPGVKWILPIGEGKVTQLRIDYQATITSAEIRKNGRLTVAFADGAMLEVLPDERYEAFTMTGSLPSIRRGFSFVAIPAGGLARC